MEGGLYLLRMDKNGESYWEYDLEINSRDRLDDLLDGGMHTDDHSRWSRRRYRCDADLPCHRMLNDFVKKHYERPELSKRRQRNRG